ncbi:MAG: NUDIX hydrolase [Calditrichaeota bacterium]|nr:MAG: NUDIX hydrolase [Calditrichota bacterium]
MQSLNHGAKGLKLLFLVLRLSAILFQRFFNLLTFGNLPPFAAVAVVVKQNEKILMIDRIDGKGLGLPGGFVRLQETMESAAVRETREETGLDIELTGILGVLSGKRPGTLLRAVDVVYSGRVIGGQLKNSFEGKCRWVNLQQEKPRVAFDYIKILEQIS